MQKTYASFLESQIYIDSLYLDVEDIAIAKLVNHSVMETEFRFGQPEGAGSQLCKIRVEPERGVLKNKSVLDVKIFITSSTLGDLNDLRIPCYVKDMEYPLFVDLSGNVKGVSVNYYFTENADSSDLDCQSQLVCSQFIFCYFF